MAFLEIKNIHKKFEKTEVLKGVDISINKGEVVVILGSSGSGKTTLLRCINFLETPDAGIISIDDEIIFDSNNTKKINNSQGNFGLVFQSFNLFPQYTALENVTLAAKIAAKKQPDFKKNKKEIYKQITTKGIKLLQQMGLEDKKYNYPCELSGGQQQRVSIARALAMNPKVLFFDEPTSALDPQLTGEILKVIRSLARLNMTMVIVTHEIEFAKNVADKIIFMDNGVVLEEGKPKDIIENPQYERTREFLGLFFC